MDKRLLYLSLTPMETCIQPYYDNIDCLVSAKYINIVVCFVKIMIYGLL